MSEINTFAKSITAALAADEPHPVDVHLGRMLRTERKRQGYSQTALAEALDNLSFQQVQKYERGANRLSGSRIWEAARFLKVSPGFFFEGLPGVNEDPDFIRSQAIHSAIAALGDFPALMDVEKLTSEQRHVVASMIEGFAKANA